MSEAYSYTISPISAAGGRTAVDGISAEDIHSQLDRILDDTHFRGSLRLTSFLKFVVDTALAGKPERIKAYTIAVEALGRTSDFDPQHDPIVRVEAGRLRQALARYYADAGRNDPLFVELPRGTYVPSFHRRTTAGATPGTDKIIDSSTEGSVAALSPESDFSRTDQIGFEAEELIGRDQKYGHNTILSPRFAKARSQMSDDSDVLDSKRRTLDQSQRPLPETAPKSAPVPPAPFAVNNAQEADAATDEDTPALSSSTQLAAVQLDEAIAAPGRMSLFASAAARMRAPLLLVKVGLVAIAALTILEVLSDIDRPLTAGAHRGLFGKLWPASDTTITQSQVGGEAAPVIYVEPIQTIGTPPPYSTSATIVHARLIDVLSRFDDVTIAGALLPNGARPAVSVAPPSVYRLEGVVKYNQEDTILVVLRLIDTADGTVVWSKTYQRGTKPDGKGTIVHDVARLLLGPFGIVAARERVKRAASNPMQDTYRCILDAAAYLRSFDPSQYQPVSECLVRASTRKAPSVTVFADLAFVYLRNYRFGISGEPADSGMLDSAYRMAERAVDIKPNSAFAQLALQDVFLAKGDIARATIAGDNSFSLNPNNAAIAFGHAWLLILTGRIDQGVALLDQNSTETPNSSIGYHLLMALAYYLKDDLNTAAAESAQIASPFFPPGLLLDALVADRLGDGRRARQDVAMLTQFYPAWRNNPAASVARFIPDRAVADRLAADFESAVTASAQ